MGMVKELDMQVGDLVFEKRTQRYGIVLFVDDEDPHCFGVFYSDLGFWDLGWSEDLEVVCK